MNETGFKKIYLPSVLCVSLILLALHLPGTCYGFEIGVDVSPNIVNIESRGDAHRVRVFTNMAYSNVALSSVYINDELIASWKTRDSWGNLIVKFYLDELDRLVENDLLVIDGENTLRVVGMTNDPEDPESFWGEGIIYVVDKQGP